MTVIAEGLYLGIALELKVGRFRYATPIELLRLLTLSQLWRLAKFFNLAHVMDFLGRHYYLGIESLILVRLDMPVRRLHMLHPVLHVRWE